MRVWDLPPRHLCRNHLLGEHRELHAVWSILTQGKRGYSHHPETLRWRGKLAALHLRHEALRAEMGRRGFAHGSPLNPRLATGRPIQNAYVDSPPEQRRILREKECGCRTTRRSRPNPSRRTNPGVERGQRRRH